MCRNSVNPSCLLKNSCRPAAERRTKAKLLLLCVSSFLQFYFSNFSRMKNMKRISRKSSILDLPSEIISKIFSLLPTKSILSCKSVCKIWRSIILNPNFSGSSEFIALIVRRYGDNRGNKKLHLVEPEIDYAVRKRNGNPCLLLSKKSVVTFNNERFGDFDVKTLKIVNSCKGLVCLTVRTMCFLGTTDAESHWAPFFVCNPFMNDFEVVEHPRSRELGDCVCRHTGFGFSSETGRHKLLRFFYRNTDESLVGEICTLGGDDQWRILDNPPQGYYWYDQGIVLQGSIHWLVKHLWTRVVSIAAFDCDKEVFVFVDLPNRLTHDPIKTDFIILGVAKLQSRLCFSMLHRDRKDCDIWVMDEYRVEESWRKLFVVSSGECITKLMPFKPLSYLKNGEILMFSVVGELVSYDVASKTWRAVKFPGVTGRADAMVFDPIFQRTSYLLTHGPQP